MHLGGSPWISIAVGIFLTGTYGLIRSVSSALGEEIGWRGFLVPELSKATSFTLTSLISGIVWSLWHYPILIYGDYNAGTPTWYGLTCFTVMVVSGSFIFAWLRLKSGSLWTGAILHASHNLYIQAIFTPLTRITGKTACILTSLAASCRLSSLFSPCTSGASGANCRCSSARRRLTAANGFCWLAFRAHFNR